MSPQGHMIHTRLTFKTTLSLSNKQGTQDTKVQYHLQLLKRKYLDVNLGKHV